jgi:protoheme ferro-lyase
MTRHAVVLFNLGAPDRLDAVEPFLFNLFSDPAVIALPAVLRRPIARLAARAQHRGAGARARSRARAGISLLHRDALLAPWR